MLKGKWDISSFKNSHGVVLSPNQENLFLILKVIYVFVIQKSNMHFYIFLIFFTDELSYI